MMRRWLGAGLAPVLAAAALLLTPSTSQAWGWGRWGGWHGGYVGWHSPYYYGYYGGWGGYPVYSSYGWTTPAYTYYGASPSYYSGYYTPYYTYSAPYYVSSPSYQSYYPSTATMSDTANRKDAQVRVEVPANAEVWFGGFKTTQTGTDRRFHSPPLAPKGNYSYEVRARWMENGKVVDRTRNVPVHAGETATVDFMQREAPARNAAIPPPNPRGETPTSTGP